MQSLSKFKNSFKSILITEELYKDILLVFHYHKYLVLQLYGGFLSFRLKKNNSYVEENSIIYNIPNVGVLNISGDIVDALQEPSTTMTTSCYIRKIKEKDVLIRIENN